MFTMTNLPLSFSTCFTWEGGMASVQNTFLSHLHPNGNYTHNLHVILIISDTNLDLRAWTNNSESGTQENQCPLVDYMHRKKKQKKNSPSVTIINNVTDCV